MVQKSGKKTHQLRLVVYPMIFVYRLKKKIHYFQGFSTIPGGWPWDFWTINSIIKGNHSKLPYISNGMIPPNVVPGFGSKHRSLHCFGCVGASNSPHQGHGTGSADKRLDAAPLLNFFRGMLRKKGGKPYTKQGGVSPKKVVGIFFGGVGSQGLKVCFEIGEKQCLGRFDGLNCLVSWGKHQNKKKYFNFSAKTCRFCLVFSL